MLMEQPLQPLDLKINSNQNLLQWLALIIQVNLEAMQVRVAAAVNDLLEIDNIVL